MEIKRWILLLRSALLSIHQHWIHITLRVSTTKYHWKPLSPLHLQWIHHCRRCTPKTSSACEETSHPTSPIQCFQKWKIRYATVTSSLAEISQEVSNETWRHQLLNSMFEFGSNLHTDKCARCCHVWLRYIVPDSFSWGTVLREQSFPHKSSANQVGWLSPSSLDITVSLTIRQRQHSQHRCLNDRSPRRTKTLWHPHAWHRYQSCRLCNQNLNQRTSLCWSHFIINFSLVSSNLENISARLMLFSRIRNCNIVRSQTTTGPVIHLKGLPWIRTIA